MLGFTRQTWLLRGHAAYIRKGNECWREAQQPTVDYGHAGRRTKGPDWHEHTKLRTGGCDSCILILVPSNVCEYRVRVVFDHDYCASLCHLIHYGAWDTHMQHACEGWDHLIGLDKLQEAAQGVEAKFGNKKWCRGGFM